MTLAKVHRVVLGANLAALFALALWFRVSSLGCMPYSDGDEAFYGVQAGHAIYGRPVATMTPTGNYLNVFAVGMQIPFLLVLRPAMWITRAPAVISGILAVLLTYVLGRRILDRATALIAATLLAVLPIAIIWSRIGYESSQSPLFGLVAVYFAFRRSRIGTCLAMAAVYLVHPTNIFLLPVVMAVYLARALEESWHDPARRLRVLITSTIVPGAVGLAVGLMKLHRPETKATFTSAFLGHDWSQYGQRYTRFFYGLGQFPLPDSTLRLHDGLFWAVVTTLLVFGTRRLVLARQWDRLALVLGAIASAVAFHIVAGKNALQGDWYALLRYGLFLVVPTVLALACLARSLLVQPREGRPSPIRYLQEYAMLAVAWGLLISVGVNWFGSFHQTKTESIWTFRTDRKDQFEEAFSAIRRDLDHGGATRVGAPTYILTEDQFLFRPIRYLALPRRDLKVANMLRISIVRARYEEVVREKMQDGAYYLVWPERTGEVLVNAIFPGRLERWDFPKGFRNISVYRLKRERPAQGPRVAGRIDPGMRNGGVTSR